MAVEMICAEGTIVRGRDINKSASNRNRAYMRLSCQDCGEQKWVRIKNQSAIKPQNWVCNSCSKRGERSHWWKGGRSHSSSGYILIYAPGHPRACNRNRLYEHIQIWEQVHNKPLPDGWIIHHLNGIRDDNRPRNLLAMPRGKHAHRLHFEAMKKRIRELEADNKLLEKALENSQMLFRIEEN